MFDLGEMHERKNEVFTVTELILNYTKHLYFAIFGPSKREHRNYLRRSTAVLNMRQNGFLAHRSMVSHTAMVGSSTTL